MVNFYDKNYGIMYGKKELSLGAQRSRGRRVSAIMGAQYLGYNPLNPPPTRSETLSKSPRPLQPLDYHNTMAPRGLRVSAIMGPNIQYTTTETP